MARVLLPVPPLREIKAIVCMGRLPIARVLPRNAKTHDKGDAKRPRIPAECLQTFTRGYPGKIAYHR